MEQKPAPASSTLLSLPPPTQGPGAPSLLRPRHWSSLPPLYSARLAPLPTYVQQPPSALYPIGKQVPNAHRDTRIEPTPVQTTKESYVREPERNRGLRKQITRRNRSQRGARKLWSDSGVRSGGGGTYVSAVDAGSSSVRAELNPYLIKSKLADAKKPLEPGYYGANPTT